MINFKWSCKTYKSHSLIFQKAIGVSFVSFVELCEIKSYYNEYIQTNTS